ncbi:proline-rich protein HaeIII subfamily 1-like [Motacilla alba alba]|uniref:proline-rich protein HaeIII subfamily 1-like n=1 Tax=Motacilla alba alba TaxID=1094192 RepID=UPI0018D55D5D|nr:proline-rich protein HaeIII subfamily 1-like [Motacilla alba alba]
MYRLNAQRRAHPAPCRARNRRPGPASGAGGGAPVPRSGARPGTVSGLRAEPEPRVRGRGQSPAPRLGLGTGPWGRHRQSPGSPRPQRDSARGPEPRAGRSQCRTPSDVTPSASPTPSPGPPPPEGGLPPSPPPILNPPQDPLLMRGPILNPPGPPTLANPPQPRTPPEESPPWPQCDAGTAGSPAVWGGVGICKGAPARAGPDPFEPRGAGSGPLGFIVRRPEPRGCGETARAERGQRERRQGGRGQQEWRSGGDTGTHRPWGNREGRGRQKTARAEVRRPGQERQRRCKGNEKEEQKRGRRLQGSGGGRCSPRSPVTLRVPAPRSRPAPSGPGPPNGRGGSALHRGKAGEPRPGSPPHRAPRPAVPALRCPSTETPRLPQRLLPPAPPRPPRDRPRRLRRPKPRRGRD